MIDSFGGVGDAKVVTDAAISVNSNLLTSASASFTTADIGKSVALNGAGVAGIVFVALIVSVFNGVATLSAYAGTTVSSANLAYGTDNTIIFRNAISDIAVNAAFGQPNTLFINPGNFMFTGSIGNIPNNVSVVGSSMYGPPETTQTTDPIYSPIVNVSAM